MATYDYEKMPIEQLQALVSGEKGSVPLTSNIASSLSPATKALQEAGNIGKAVYTGGQLGIKEFIDQNVLLLNDVLDAVGVVNPKLARKVRDDAKVLREDRARIIKELEYPTVGEYASKGSNLTAQLIEGGGVGSVAGKAAAGVGSGALAQLLANATTGSAALGALNQEDSRVEGALTGAAIGGATAGTLYGAQKLFTKAGDIIRPQRTEVGERLRNSGLPVTRDIVLGKTSEQNPVKRTLATKAKEIAEGNLDDVSPYSISERFKQAVDTNQKSYVNSANKLYESSIKDPNIQNMRLNMDFLSDDLTKIKQAAGQDSSPGIIKRLNNAIQDFVSQPRTPQEIHSFIKSDGPLAQINKSLKKEAYDMRQLGYDAAHKINSNLMGLLEKVAPDNYNKFIAANSKYKEMVSIFKDHELSSAVLNGDGNAMLSKLTNPTVGLEVKNKLLKLVGTEGKRPLDQALIQAAVGKATKGGVLDGQAFTEILLKLKTNAKYSFPAETQKMVDNITDLLSEAAKTGSISVGTPKFAEALGESAKRASNIPGVDSVIGGIKKLLDSDLGIKLLTKAPRGTFKGKTGVELISVLSKAGAALATEQKGPVDSQGRNYEEMDLNQLQDLISRSSSD